MTILSKIQHMLSRIRALKSTAIDNVPFQTLDQVYLASADVFEETQKNLDQIKHQFSSSTPLSLYHFQSVVGGLSGLNYLTIFSPQKITFFDINPFAVEYVEFVVELILACNSPQEFISLMFLRDVNDFENKNNVKLSFSNQMDFLNIPANFDYIESTRSILSQKSYSVYLSQVIPAVIQNAKSPNTRNCNRLLPCWPQNRRVPVGPLKAFGYNHEGFLEINTNTFFYGLGWLATEDSFRQIRNTLLNSGIKYCVSDFLKEATKIISHGHSNFIHISNIDTWFPENFNNLKTELETECKKSMTSLTILSSESHICFEYRDSHCFSYETILDVFKEKQITEFTEISHKKNWGFTEFGPKRTELVFPPKKPISNQVLMLHILRGNGISPTEISASLTSSNIKNVEIVLVLEHDGSSQDWIGKNIQYDSSRILTDFYDSLFRPLHYARTAQQKIQGEKDNHRNILIVYEKIEN